MNQPKTLEEALTSVAADVVHRSLRYNAQKSILSTVQGKSWLLHQLLTVQPSHEVDEIKNHMALGMLALALKENVITPPH
jgi:hypothetical protein